MGANPETGGTRCDEVLALAARWRHSLEEHVWGGR